MLCVGPLPLRNYLAFPAVAPANGLNEPSSVTRAIQLLLQAAHVWQKPLLGYATISDAEYRHLVDLDPLPRWRLAEPPTLIGPTRDVVNHHEVSLGNDALDVFAPVWKRFVKLSYVFSQALGASCVRAVRQEVKNEVRREEPVDGIDLGLVPDFRVHLANERLVALDGAVGLP
jgi:hypothetical protein